MTPANSGLTAILCCTLVVFSGCGQSDTAGPLTADNDALLNELLGSTDSESENSDPETDESQDVMKTVSSGTEVQSTEDDTSDSIVDDILGGRDDDHTLSTSLVGRTARTASIPSGGRGNLTDVQLNVGDQFPFVKTVRQTVVQTSTNRNSKNQSMLNAETQMQLTLNLSVQSSSPAGIVFNVQYLRVQYFQNIDGQQQSFDSSTAQSASIPAGLEAYAGMVGSGFRFTLSGQNKIETVDGLSSFLDQCVSASPFDRRVDARSALEQRFQNGAVAELVDESIALLPYGSTRPQQGDVWVTSRSLQQQPPISMQTTCRLVSLTDTTAEIGLTGRFESTAANGALQISDGRTMGTCIVDLASGMPLHSQRSSYLKVSAEQPRDLIEITKRIESTFTSQNQSARLLVQQHGTGSSAVSTLPEMPSGSTPAMAPFQTESRSAALSQGSSSYRNPANAYGSANGIPSYGANNATGSFSGMTGGAQSIPAQPVSSSNPYGQPTPGAPLQIPGGVSPDQLQSTTEAVYPD